MKLATGTRLGPYEIEHAIGHGGMGVVYRADDGRVGRKVAIKILPSATGENWRRFEREARTIGALNHPNLLTLYDVGSHEGTPFLVTEMLDGESLRVRLSKGKLKLREAIVIAADVARGLGAAHDAGVIHRDVKPDNIFLTTEGRTKILDFGIAKLRRSTLEMEAATADPEVDIAHEPTQQPTTADTGLVIGTPGYMAPEQLDGGKVDERTDIFALGVVLYEMISGKRAFAAENAVEESYAILKTTPEPPKGATKSAARVVMRCLEKRPEARFQSARDLAFALDELDASTDPIARISKTAIADDRLSAVTIRDDRPPEMEKAPGSRKWIAIAAAAAIVFGIGGVLVGRKLAGSSGLEPRWPTVVEGGASYRRLTYHSQPTWDARLAANGESVFYSRTQDDKAMIMRVQIGTASILPTGIAGRLADLSKRGEIAAITDELSGVGGTLSRVIEGSGPTLVADRVTEASWMPDDSLAVIRGERELEYPIGTPIVKRTVGKLAMLRASRDGKWFAFADLASSTDTQGRVVIVDASGKEIAGSGKQDGIEGMAWSLDGNEVWFSNGPTIFALDRSGTQRVVLHGITRHVLVDVNAGKILVAPSDVRLKMFTGPRSGEGYREVSWFDASEIESVSSDGKTLAFIEGTGTGSTGDGYAAFLRRSGALASPLTNGYHLAMLPDASAAIVLVTESKLVRISTGVNKPTPIPIAPIEKIDIGDRLAMAWSGKYVVVRGNAPGKPMQLWRIDLEKGEVLPIESSSEGGWHPIAPDGQTIATARMLGGIEIKPVTGGTPRVIEAAVGEQPLSFTGDGSALFTLRVIGDSLAVDRIELADGKRQSWARITPEQRPSHYSVVLSADGEIITYSTSSHATDLYVLEQPSTTP